MVDKWQMGPAERAENGSATADILDMLPWGVGEKIAEAGPFARFLTTLGGSFLKRMEFSPMTEIQNAGELQRRRAEAATKAAATRTVPVEVVAPNPNNVQPVRPHGADIFVPPPPGHSAQEVTQGTPAAPLITEDMIRGNVQS